MRFALLAVVTLALAAQSPKGEKIESCGLGSKHNCHCIERTDRIQNRAAELCNSGDWRNYYKTQAECIREKLYHMDHCSIAETWTEYDEESGTAEERDGHYVTASTMGPMCQMACKKHDCKCQDGPTCHYGHDISEHRGEK